jgi:hypothetical protein
MGGLVIYTFPSTSDPIRQGDIFFGVPRIDFNLEKIPVLVDDHFEETAWDDLAFEDKPITALMGAKPVKAIVISQDCDSLRVPDITLCEIRDFRSIELKCKDTQKPNKWVKIITQHARINQKWFYLPPDNNIGFKDKMGVDFLLTIRIHRVDLEKLRFRRKGCLNEVARNHFRERISEFYRRYSYNEWYPLNKEEIEFYQKDYPDAEPYPWQNY